MLLEMKNVSKAFPQQEILKNIDYSVDYGQLIHIIGGNGSGKSTLFKIICRIMEADAGDVLLDAQVELGALIENPNFMEGSTMKQNLRFLGSIKKQFNEEVTRTYAKRLGIDYESKIKLGKYSVGMRQKVGIIQAIMENQNLILLDEPTRGLDDASLKAFREIINELIAANKTVLIASHDNLSQLDFDAKYTLSEGDLRLN